MQSQRHYKQTVLQLALDCQGRSGERSQTASLKALEPAAPEAPLLNPFG